MPLIKSGTREAISENISEMVKSGHKRSQAIAAALSTARRYGKAAGGEAFDAGGQATLRRYGRPNIQWDKNPKRMIEGGIKPYVLPEDEMNTSGGEWARQIPKPVDLADGGGLQGEGWDMDPPEPLKPYAIQPGLQESQMGQSEVPEGYAVNDAGEVFNKQTGETAPIARRPSILPITKDPEGKPRFAMPRVADIASNIIGGNVPLGGGEMLLGSGLMKGVPATSETESLLKQLAAQSKKPIPLMKINQTHSIDDVVNSLADADYISTSDSGLVTKKQMSNISGILNKADPATLAEKLKEIPDHQYENIASWLSEKKQEDVMHLISSAPDEMQAAYEYKQAKHEAGPEWNPEGEPASDIDDYFGIQHPKPEANLPPEILEKAERLGLNQVGYHGSRHEFDFFKLPEEITHLGGIKNTPELGIHFGTQKAANDRLGVTGLFKKEETPSADQIFQDYFPSDPQKWDKSRYNVIPAIFGAKKPLAMPDLGTWTAGRVSSQLKSHNKFTADEVNKAMDVPGSVYSHDRDLTQMKNLRNLIESKGYDSVEYLNKVEDPGSVSYITWHPNKARSFYAKFLPQNAHLRNLGAALGGLSIVPLGVRSQQQESPMKRGGSIDGALRTARKYAAGGSQFMENMLIHNSARNLHSEGFIKSGVPGRTDKLPMNVPAGSYVLPADIPSALGQGNSTAGGHILSKMFNSGPGGMPLPKIGGGRPHMPRLNLSPQRMPKNPMGFDAGGDVEPLQIVNTPSGSYQTPHLGMAPAWAPRPSKKNAMTRDEFEAFKNSLTGKKDGGETGTVPIIAAGGEFIVHPDVVKDIGHGSMEAGHKVLDQFVLHTRKQHIATLKGLKGPKK